MCSNGHLDRSRCTVSQGLKCSTCIQKLRERSLFMARGGTRGGGKNFATYSPGGEGVRLFFSILFGRGDFFSTHYFLGFFFSQKLHYMYFNSCRSTTAT